jgi:regulator of replication initiation timing
MPYVGSTNSVGAPRIVLERAMKALGNNIDLIGIHNREGAVAPPAAPCRASNTIGVHEQRAHADAISVSYRVLVAAREKTSDPGHRAALDKSLGHIGETPQQSYGPRVMNRLTVLGAALAGVRHEAQRAPDNKDLVDCESKLESAIVKIGLKAGACKGIATGGYHGDRASLKLTEAMEQGQDAILACRQMMGDSVLLDGIVSAVLPAAMMQSLQERMPDVAAAHQGRMGSLDLMQVLQKQYADGTRSAVEHQMQTGCPEAFANAVFGLLKLPQYVMEGEPGGNDPANPPGPSVPANAFPPIPAMPTGGNQAVNQVYVDNADFGKALSGLAGKLDAISNLTVKDAIELGKQLGRLEARNEALEHENTDLRNRLDHPEDRFSQDQQRLNGWNSASLHPLKQFDQFDSGFSIGGGGYPPRYDGASPFSDGKNELLNRSDSGQGSMGRGVQNDVLSSGAEKDTNASDQSEVDELVFGGMIKELDELQGRLQRLRTGAGTGEPASVAANTASPHGENSTSNPAVPFVNASGSTFLGAQEEDVLQTSTTAGQQWQKTRNEGQDERRFGRTVNATNVGSGVNDEAARRNERRSELTRSSSVSSVAALVRKFESSSSSRTQASDVVDGHAAQSALRVQAAQRATNTGARVADNDRDLSEVMVPVSRRTLDAGPARVDINEEFNALVDYRREHGDALTPVRLQDGFRAHWQAAGGLPFRPVVAPVAPRKETILLREHELERVNFRIAENLARNRGVLQGIFPPKHDRSSVDRTIEDSDAILSGTDDDRGGMKVFFPEWKSSTSVDGEDSGTASAAGSEPNGDQHFQADGVPPAKQLFQDDPARLRQQQMKGVLGQLMMVR